MRRCALETLKVNFYFFRLQRSSSPLVDQVGDEPRPAGLVRGAEAGAGVAVEVLEELQIVAPVRIVLKFRGRTEGAPSAVGTAREETDHPVGELARHVARRQRAVW